MAAKVVTDEMDELTTGNATDEPGGCAETGTAGNGCGEPCVCSGAHVGTEATASGAGYGTTTNASPPGTSDFVRWSASGWYPIPIGPGEPYVVS